MFQYPYLTLYMCKWFQQKSFLIINKIIINNVSVF